MRTSDALVRLNAHQADILAQLDHACALLLLDPIPAQSGLARARWEMVRKLKAYQIFKHTEIFGPALASGPPAHVVAAQQMKAECIAAGEAFRAYTVLWSGSDVAGSWSDYKVAMTAMVQTLRGHIARESQEVTALLAGAKRTRRLADA